MKKEFKLDALITVSAYTIVEAESLEEAIKISKERNSTYSERNTDVKKYEMWIVEEIDGEPQNIEES